MIDLLQSLLGFTMVAYVEDNTATPSGNVKIYRIGGARIYSGFNSDTQEFAHQMQGHDLLRRVSDSPVRHERIKPDGSKEVYEASNGVAGPGRKVFLTKVIDPQGNVITNMRTVKNS